MLLITEYRLEHIIQALRRVITFEQPADVLLRHYFQDEHSIGAKDRTLISEAVFGVLRHKILLDHCCTTAASETQRAQTPTARRLSLAWLFRFGGYNLRELEPVLKITEKDWLATVKQTKVENLPLEIQAELPQWLIEKMSTQFSQAEILELGQGLQQNAPLDIRVNALLAKRDEVLEQLQAQGIEASATPYSPVGIRMRQKHPLHRDALFTEGKIEIQDEGSQLLGFLLAPKRNHMVVDFCAGAGGKTLMLSALMSSHGRLYALDVSEKRLNNLKPRLKRSGASNIQPMLIDHENDNKVKRLAGKIDRVLVDAPCSGMGTLRRNPDLKFRQSPTSLAELSEKQSKILESASRLLKSGGCLVYATCSFLAEENQRIVEQFLSKHPEFTLKPVNEVLTQQKIPLQSNTDYLELRPQQHGTDGFFAAVLERQ